MGPPYGKLPILFITIPIIIPIRIPEDMAMVWVPLTIFGCPMSLGVPGIILETMGAAPTTSSTGKLLVIFLANHNNEEHVRLQESLNMKKFGGSSPKIAAKSRMF